MGPRARLQRYLDVLIEPAATEGVASVMQLLAECAERDASGAIATVFHVDGNVETTIGARALLYPDGTIDGNFPPLAFQHSSHQNYSTNLRP